MWYNKGMVKFGPRKDKANKLKKSKTKKPATAPAPTTVAEATAAMGLISEAEAARMLGKTLRQMRLYRARKGESSIGRDDLGWFQDGKWIRYDRAAVLAYLAKHRVGPKGGTR